MVEPLVCRRLRVTRCRGVDPPGIDLTELAPGINLIYGPNASGKSTVGIALQRLIWPALAAGDELLEAEFEHGQRRWNVALESGSARRSGDSPERMPAVERRDRYHLSLHDLLQASNRGFAAQIQRDALGGFDIPGAADELGFGAVSPRAGKSTRKMRSAADAVSSRREKRRELVRRERQLETLRDELERARHAARRADRLEQVVEIKRVQSELQARRRELDAFDSRHELIDGDEFDRAEELIARRRDAEARLDKQRRDVREAREQLDDIELPEDGVSEEALRHAEEQLDALEELERSIRDAEQTRLGASREMERLEQRFSDLIAPDIASDAELVDGAVLEELLRKMSERRARREARHVFERRFHREDIPDQRTIDDYRDGIRALRRWLAAQSHESSGSRDHESALVRIAATATLAALSAGVLVAVWHRWLGAAAIIVAIGCAIWLGVTVYRLTDETSETMPADLARSYQNNTELEPPESWTVSSVERRLDALHREVADAILERRSESLWQSRKSSLEIDGTSSEGANGESVEEIRERAIASLGVAPELEGSGEVALYRTVEHLERYQRAADELERARSGLQQRREQRAELFDALGELFDQWHHEPPESVAEATAMVRTLRSREASRREAVADLEQAISECQQAQQKLERLQREVRELFERCDLPEDDLSRLRSLCDRHDEWEALREEAQELESRFRVRREDFTSNVDGIDGLPAPPWKASRGKLEEERELADRQANEISDLEKQIQQIENELEEARASKKLERAAATYRQRREELADERRRDYKRRVGRALAEFVHQKTRDRDLPDVFHRARELFATVTRGAYRLELNDRAEPEFRAYDTVAERHQPLDTLSTGTRLQLLLTVRMAFTERGERDMALPMVFDETLANSDDRRARALVDAILEVARRGRQVFYLTAQADEVRQWRARTESDAAPSIRLFKLDSRGDREGAVDAGESMTNAAAEAWWSPVEAPNISAEPEVPAPASRSHAAYRDALDPGGWHPRDPIGELHLWFVVEDVSILYDLLDNGIRTWGQLRTLGAGGAGNLSDLTPEHYERIEARADAVAAFADAWRVGRGEPVDRAVLEASGAVSSNFIDEVAELCATSGGDAEQILDGLEAGEVKRFRSSKIEELREYFRAGGHLVDEDPLTDRQIRTKVLAAVSTHIRDGRLEAEAVDRIIRRVAES